jgi:Rha family phage regulatory protein
MAKDLVEIKGKAVVTDSLTVAENFGKRHDDVLKKIKNIMADDDEDRLNFAEMSYPDSYGREQKKCIMDRRSFSILCMSFTGKKALKWKNRFYDAFEAMEKALVQMSVQRQSDSWLAQRQAGKLIRREQTDTIQEFVEYATSQGSTQAHRYYCNITKMENQALFLLEQKFKNLRDILDLNQLGLVRTADSIVKKALKDGMSDGLHYKDIYRLAKDRVETLAEIHGKTFIPASQIENHNRLMVEA